MTYVLPVDAMGYRAGIELREVTLREARAMECNRCGDCCSGMRPGVAKDEATGLPLHVWEARETAADEARSQTADPDRYRGRLDEYPLFVPIVMRDGGIGLGERFERDADGMPHTSFACRALIEYPGGADGPETGCAIHETPETYATSVLGLRPYNCGAFPVFGLEVSDSIIQHGYFVPPTGSLPRCTWYGLRVTGPFKDTPYWEERFARQERGEVVPELSNPVLHEAVAASLSATR